MARLGRNFTGTGFCVIALSVATGATALASGETFQSPTTGQPGAPTNTWYGEPDDPRGFGHFTRISVQRGRSGGRGVRRQPIDCFSRQLEQRGDRLSIPRPLRAPQQPLDASTAVTGPLAAGPPSRLPASAVTM